MIDVFKNFLIKLLPAGFKGRIKKAITSFKSRYPKVLIFFNGSFSTSELLKEIDSRIPDNTEVLMIHTSFNNMKPMFRGTVNELLDALISYAAARDITLVFPGFVLGKNNADIKMHYLRKKKFDINRSPTTVGLLNECFRRREGVKRSSHPSHSLLVLGPKADEILTDHHLCDTTFGEKTPFHNIEKFNSVIVGLGVYFYRNLTHVHVAEDLLGERFPYPVSPSHETVPVELVLGNERVPYDLKVFNKELSGRRNLFILKKYMGKEHLYQYNFKGMPMFIAQPGKVTSTLLHLAAKGITIYRS